MIFITLGSQKFQFNRLLEKVDELIRKKIITEPAFAQTGNSDYVPQGYPYEHFLDWEVYEKKMSEADIIITHGGTGAIVGAVKKGKKVVAVPRLKKYGEHIDDHQLQIIEQFGEQNLICGLHDCSELEEGLRYVGNHEFTTFESNTKTVIDSIDNFIRTEI
jgi:UDP-N-acetylglucosamine transferase subunit ALG13